MDERHKNKIENAQTFLGKLHNEKRASPESMLIACQDLRQQMEQAALEGVQEFRILGYSDDLIQYLAKEKESVEELMDYVDNLVAGLQDHVEEIRREKEGSGLEDPEEENNFEDAKETGSITSNTSKT